MHYSSMIYILFLLDLMQLRPHGWVFKYSNETNETKQCSTGQFVDIGTVCSMIRAYLIQKNAGIRLADTGMSPGKVSSRLCLNNRKLSAMDFHMN